MAAQVGSTFFEGQSTNRPPLFNGSNYSYWKARMKIFIQALDYDLWSIIVNGPHTPTTRQNGMEILKPKMEWDEHDRKLAQLNAKAMNVLYCSLDANEFNRISVCISAKKIWDRLEVTHEGTNQVKESKINMLVHRYKLFKMDACESISDMFTRFTDIVNGLKSLGKSYDNTDLVRKVLRSLPRTWEAKVTAIQEAKDLNTLPLEELLGSLMTHELQVKQHVNDEESKKKKTMALKISENMEESNESKDDSDDEDMALITRKFRRFMKKKKFEKKKPFIRKDEEKGKEKELTCFECKKPGHFKSECPQLKKNPRRFKKKAMMATWSDSDTSSFEEEEKAEMANLCFMADNGEVSPSFLDDFTFDKLYGAFYELIDDYANLSSKNKDLKN